MAAKLHLRARFLFNLLVFVFRSLGHVHKLAIRGFQQLWMPKRQLNSLQNSVLSLLLLVAA